MADLARLRRRGSTFLMLRAVLMLLGGLYALIFPGAALTVLVIAGGALLLVDGVLGLWGLTFGGQDSRIGNYWFDVVRNVLSILTGVVILFSPFIATLFTATVLVYIVAFQAIIVGVMEIVVVMRERALYSRIWPVALNGALYILFGVVLLFWPLAGALTMVMLGGALMIVFAIGLFMLALRLRKPAA